MATPPPPGWEPTQLVPRRDRGNALPAGTQLQEFVLEAPIGTGGFSIVYRARDLRLNRVVAIKEYMPALLADRAANGRVAARSPQHRAPFESGLKSFVNEARLLASFEHASLVKVHRFWAENDTAYMVMPLYEGVTLRQWLQNLGAPPSEAWLRALAEPLIDALDALHHERCWHRDVAPDNILLLHDKRAAGSYLEQKPRPLLLDFGAARRVISEQTQQLTAFLKSGYTPVEQYGGEAVMRQGPWTDVYALAAVLYAAMNGKVPPSAIARSVKDELVPAMRAGAGRYSPAFLAAVDAGLAVMPQQRPQTMADWRRLFEAPPPPPFTPPPPWWQRLWPFKGRRTGSA
jgi:serine/threonine protein kinase